MSGSLIKLAVLGTAFSCGAHFAWADYSFTRVDFPVNIFGTSLNGINSRGQIVGCAFKCGEDFLYDGAFNPALLPFGTQGINDSDQIVGFQFENIAGFDSGPASGFVAHVGDEFVTPVTVPGSRDTFVSGINDGGQIVGYFDGATSEGGFLLSGGTFIPINVPGAAGTFPEGINNKGQIVGIFADASGRLHGFLDTRGSFTTIDFPGAPGTFLFGINDNGQIVGDTGTFPFGISRGGGGGFVYSDGTFAAVNFPGATKTAVNGINDNGEIVGSFDSPDTPGAGTGFLATPTPEPRSFPLLGACVIGILWVRRRHNAERKRTSVEVPGPLELRPR